MTFTREGKAHRFVNNVGSPNQLGTLVVDASNQFATREIAGNLVICVFKQIQFFAQNVSHFAGNVGHGIAQSAAASAFSCKNKMPKKKKVRSRWQGNF